jgi:ADP-ribose pyrophosphatase YjhB (NUDIX family)
MIRTESAGGVVLNGAGQVLVVNQKGTSWSLPKGHIEEGEDALTAARREIFEEAGVSQLEYEGECGSYSRYKIGADGGEDASELKTIYMFLFKTKQAVLSPTDGDNPEARWVESDEVASFLTHTKDREFFLSVLERLRAEGVGAEPQVR